MSVRLQLIAAFVCAYFAGILPADAQKEDKKAAKEAAITKKIQEKHYVFQAEQAMAMGGRLRQLQPGYTLKVAPDKIVADLPYYGRAYSASLSSSDAGIKFTSTKFEYKIENRKKGGWDITIRPGDASDFQQLNLTAFPNGRCSIQVTSTNRQPMSFEGYIQEK